MTESVEARLRKNTFSGTFEGDTEAVRAIDVHRVVFTKLGLTSTDIWCIQCELGIKKFYVKLTKEEKLREVLSRRSVDYAFQDGTKTTVKLEDAGQGVTTVRVFRLPPEVDNSHVRGAFAPYGRVLEVYDEKWANYEGCGLRNGIRGVRIEIQENAKIPTWFKIRGVEVKAEHSGQRETCRKCHEPGHNLYLCPKRTINKPGGRRWEENQANNNNNQHQPPKPVQTAKPSNASGGETRGVGASHTLPVAQPKQAASAATLPHGTVASQQVRPAEQEESGESDGSQEDNDSNPSSGSVEEVHQGGKRKRKGKNERQNKPKGDQQGVQQVEARLTPEQDEEVSKILKALEDERQTITPKDIERALKWVRQGGTYDSLKVFKPAPVQTGVGYEPPPLAHQSPTNDDEMNDDQ